MSKLTDLLLGATVDIVKSWWENRKTVQPYRPRALRVKKSKPDPKRD